MKKSIRKFLEFNGKAIGFLSIDGQYWVAIKPICEALGVDWSRQYKNLKSHRFFNRVRAVQPLHDRSDRVQNMVALPERYVYGWIFQINSASEELANYQQECCDILFNHFHGIMSSRRELINENHEMRKQIEIAEEALMENPEYKTYLDLKNGVAINKRTLTNLDKKLVTGQTDIFDQ